LWPREGNEKIEEKQKTTKSTFTSKSDGRKEDHNGNCSEWGKTICKM
jgi:hypothetical protein